MIKRIVGILVAAVATYMFGFVYWGGPNPLPYAAWKQPADVAVAGAALKQHFPENGTYFIPGNPQTHEGDNLGELFSAGPVAMIHMTNVEGRSMMDVGILAGGLVLYLAAAAFLTLFLYLIRDAIHCPRSCLLVSLGLAIFATLFIDVGDAVWWETPLSWKVHVIGYNGIAIFIMSLIVSLFTLWAKKGVKAENA